MFVITDSGSLIMGFAVKNLSRRPSVSPNYDTFPTLLTSNQEVIEKLFKITTECEHHLASMTTTILFVVEHLPV